MNNLVQLGLNLREWRLVNYTFLRMLPLYTTFVSLSSFSEFKAGRWSYVNSFLQNKLNRLNPVKRQESTSEAGGRFVALWTEISCGKRRRGATGFAQPGGHRQESRITVLEAVLMERAVDARRAELLRLWR